MKELEIIGTTAKLAVPEHVQIVEDSKAIKISAMITGTKVSTFNGANRLSIQVNKEFSAYDKEGNKTTSHSFTKPCNAIVSALLETGNVAIVNLLAKYGVDMYIDTKQENVSKFDMVAVGTMCKGFIINAILVQVAEGSPRWQNQDEVYQHNALHVEIESIVPSTAQIEFFNENTLNMEKTSQLVMNCRDFVEVMKSKEKAAAETAAAETAATAALVTSQPTEL